MHPSSSSPKAAASSSKSTEPSNVAGAPKSSAPSFTFNVASLSQVSAWQSRAASTKGSRSSNGVDGEASVPSPSAAGGGIAGNAASATAPPLFGHKAPSRVVPFNYPPSRTTPHRRESPPTAPVVVVADDEDDAPKCPNHALPCVRRITQKPGPNLGRPFWICCKPHHSRCNFFKWAGPRVAPSGGQVGPTTSSHGDDNNNKNDKLPSLTKKVIYVNKRRQSKNPVLKMLINVPYELSDIEPDFVTGSMCALLYLSLKYHRMKSEYISRRIRTFGRWKISVLLVLVDLDGDVSKELSDLAMLSLRAGMTLLLAFSPREAARYIETFKAYEAKSASAIKERIEEDYSSRLTGVLTCSRGINKTDVATLSSRFGNLKKIFGASKEELLICPGMGESKVRWLHETIHKPFRPAKKAKVDHAVSSSQQGGR